MRARPPREGVGPRPLAESVKKVLGRLGAPPSATTMEIVFSRWGEVAGPQVSEHTRPLRVEAGVLVIAADHPVWATRARVESAHMVDRARALGDTWVEHVQVVVERP